MVDQTTFIGNTRSETRHNNRYVVQDDVGAAHGLDHVLDAVTDDFQAGTAEMTEQLNVLLTEQLGMSI